MWLAVCSCMPTYSVCSLCIQFDIWWGGGGGLLGWTLLFSPTSPGLGVWVGSKSLGSLDPCLILYYYHIVR